MHKKTSKQSFIIPLAAALAMGIGTGNSAYAQDSSQALEEVVVTGSRIVRRDYEANSPIVTVETADLESRAGLNVEAYLNQLPNFNPAASPVTTENDIQPTAVNSVGIASISLRGFGPNRNLVLVDGHRATPNNALMVTDVNSIPTAMVERVEIISGGASAVYGADAIGGVTNFILNKDFEGAEFDFQRSETAAGDGAETRTSITLGTDYSDGRGNITVSMEKYKREIALERNRDFYRDSWTDPYQLSDDLFVYGSSGVVTNSFNPNAPDPVALRALFPDSPSTTNQRTLGGAIKRFRTGPQGEIWTIHGDNLSKYEAVGGIYNEEYAKAYQFDDTIGTPGQVVERLKWNDREQFVSAPQDRHSVYVSTHFDLNEEVSFFSSINFSKSETNTLQFGTVPIWGWESSAPFNPTVDSPLDPSLDWTDPAQVTAAVANPGAFANPNFIPTGSGYWTWCDPAGANATTCGTAGTNTRANADPALDGTLINNHPVPNEVAMLLMMRPTTDASYMVELYPSSSMPRRETDNTITYWQFEAGLDFELPLKDWTGQIYWSHGESDTLTQSTGNLSLTRWRALVNTPDWGRGLGTDPANPVEGNVAGSFDFGGNVGEVSWTPGNSRFGAPQIQCTSGLYETFFGGTVNGAQPMSDDCFNLVNAPLKTTRNNQQDVLELNFQGGVFDLPAGEVRASVGYSYRDNASQFAPDSLQSYYSFTDQVVGLYPASFLDASTDVSDFYGELLIPIVSDLPYLQLLELELGARTSDYEFADSTDTYKILANIQINDSLRFRGGFNRANRAPNLGELFLSKQEVYLGASGASFGDPCGLRSNATYGAGGTSDTLGGTPLPDPIITGNETQPTLNPGQTPEGAYSTFLICSAQMGPEAAQIFYYETNATGASPSFADWWRLQQGNPNLQSEEADTYSFGFVFTNVSDNPWLAGLTGSIDWWQVDIDNAIQQYTPDHAGYLCYGANIVSTPEEAAAQAATRACQNVPRSRTNGVAATKLVEYDNQATISTAGFDVSLNWTAQFADLGLNVPGGINISTLGTILDYYETKASPASYDVLIDWKGSLGPDLEGTNPGAYDYRFNTSFNYFYEDFSVSLRWRHLPKIITAAKALENATIANNKRVAGGGDGVIKSYTPVRDLPIDSYNVFDLSMNYQINDTLALRAGINNLLDADPSSTGKMRQVDSSNREAECSAAAESLGCTDPNDSNLELGIYQSGSGVTNAGFYDTIGRSFFLGIKATF